MSEAKIIPIDYREEEICCNLVSSFRTALGQINSLFLDLIKYHIEFKDECSKIAKINNEHIRKFILPDEKVHDAFTHKRSVSIIFKYLNESSEAPKLLNKIREQIKNKFDNFLQSPESPYNGLNISKKSLIELLTKKLDQYKNSIDDTKKQPRVFDEYFDEISSICNRDNQEEEDSEETSTNDRRFFSDPYPSFSKSAQRSINQFMTYVNLLILLRIILNFRENIDKACEKANIEFDLDEEDPQIKIKKLEKEIELLKIENQKINKENEKLQTQKEQIEGEKYSLTINLQKEKKENEKLSKELKKLKDEIEALRSQPERTNTVKFDVNSDEVYLSAVSFFRRTIDNMNSSFVDLIHNFDTFKNDCVEIFKYNKKFIYNIVNDNSSDLTHYEYLNNTFKYYTMKPDNSQNNIMGLLHKLRKDINIYLKNYHPFDVLHLDKNIHDSLTKCLNDAINKAENLDMTKNPAFYDSFLEDKIEPIFDKDSFEDSDNENEDNERNERRYFKNPFPKIPSEIKRKIDHFTSLINSFITLSIIINFDQYIDKVSIVKLEKNKDKNLKQIKMINEFVTRMKEMNECNPTDNYDKDLYLESCETQLEQSKALLSIIKSLPK